MPRKLRVQYPGAMYQVMRRGDCREDIFLNVVDRGDFLKTLAEAAGFEHRIRSALMANPPLPGGPGSNSSQGAM